MSKRRSHKDVFALQFPNGGGVIGGPGVVTSATELRVGDVLWDEALGEPRALEMLRRASIEATEWSLHEHADSWLIRFRVASLKR